MSDPFERAVERERAERRGRRHKAVWQRLGLHMRIYLVVNLGLAVIWGLQALVTSDDDPWFLSVVWGWGIGLFIHYLIVTQVTRQWRPATRHH
jgi:hypothetical protein